MQIQAFLIEFVKHRLNLHLDNIFKQTGFLLSCLRCFLHNLSNVKILVFFV